jgi:hypothetical protein
MGFFLYFMVGWETGGEGGEDTHIETAYLAVEVQ